MMARLNTFCGLTGGYSTCMYDHIVPGKPRQHLDLLSRGVNHGTISSER